PNNAIVNGTPTSAYPSVGLVGDTSGFFCTGTLIGAQFVLTAGHCADGVGNTAGRFRVGNTTYATSQVLVHPQYNDNAIGSDNAHDIAIYKLNQSVSGITPSPIYRAAPQVGQILTLVGFGAGGTGNAGHDGSFGTKRVGTTPIDQVTSRLIHWDFDNNGESNTAPGDSGGPAFLVVGGVFQVAGVTSGGDQANAGIGDHSFDTRVDAYQSWIDPIVNASAQATVRVLASDASAAETTSNQVANPGVFTISRTGSTTGALTVSFTVAGTATNGTDYSSLASQVTIPAGQSSTTITVNPVNDLLVEGTETVQLSLSAGSAYAVDTTAATAAVSITDNDAAATSVSLQIVDGNASETRSGQTTDPGTIRVTRTGSTTSALTVTLNITGSATNGTDYQVVS
ncbi:MAG TPA: trypsin-like serine protease, partial [Pirellulaceae bacterium]